MTISPLRVSRLPVGSSASTTRGERHRARPIQGPEKLQERRLPRARGPEDRDETPSLDRQVERIQRPDQGRVLAVGPARVLELVGRRDVAYRAHLLLSVLWVGHSALRSASAGRSRAARRPPAAPASRPPTIARPIASISSPGSTGAPRTTSVLPALTFPCPAACAKGSKPPVDCSSTDASSVGPIASMIAAPATPTAAPRSPPSAPCTSDSPV